MLVYISKYPRHYVCTLYERWCEYKYGKILFVDLHEENIEPVTFVDKAVDNVINKLDQYIQFFYDHTLNKIGRTNRTEFIRLNREDAWNVDNTISIILIPLLQRLKEDKQGAPLVDDEDVPEYLKSSVGAVNGVLENGDVDDNFFKRWDYVLDEMIYAFSYDIHEQPMPLFKEEYERAEKGRMLFCKYYYSLWS